MWKETKACRWRTLSQILALIPGRGAEGEALSCADSPATRMCSVSGRCYLGGPERREGEDVRRQNTIRLCIQEGVVPLGTDRPNLASHVVLSNLPPRVEELRGPPEVLSLGGHPLLVHPIL